MPTIKNTKVTIGGPEATPGVAEARTHVVPIRAMVQLDNNIEKVKDPVIIGKNMASGSKLSSEDAKGNIPLAPRPCGGMGKILRSALGTAITPFEIGGCMRIKYTGSEASCKLTAAGTDLTSEIGDLGSEAGDSNFGTDGSIDLTDEGSDTLSELIALIDSYADYSAENVFGEDSLDVQNIHAAIRQGKDREVYIFFGLSGSGVYAHQYLIDLSDTERPTYTYQKDGFQGDFVYPGGCPNSLSFSGSLKGIVDADTEILAMAEAVAGSPSEAVLEDVEQMMFADGVTILGGIVYTFPRNLSLAFNNNLNPDGFGQGSYSRLYHEKGDTVFTLDLQLRLDANSFAERAKVKNGSVIGGAFSFKSGMYTEDIPALLIFEMPHLELQSFTFQENGALIDAKLNAEGIYPKGTVYDNPMIVTMLTRESGVY